MAGAWRVFEFDVTGVVVPGKPNALAVEVFPPTPHDLAITFVTATAFGRPPSGGSSRTAAVPQPWQSPHWLIAASGISYRAGF